MCFHINYPTPPPFRVCESDKWWIIVAINTTREEDSGRNVGDDEGMYGPDVVSNGEAEWMEKHLLEMEHIEVMVTNEVEHYSSVRDELGHSFNNDMK